MHFLKFTKISLTSYLIILPFSATSQNISTFGSSSGSAAGPISFDWSRFMAPNVNLMAQGAAGNDTGSGGAGGEVSFFLSQDLALWNPPLSIGNISATSLGGQGGSPDDEVMPGTGGQGGPLNFAIPFGVRNDDPTTPTVLINDDSIQLLSAGGTSGQSANERTSPSGAGGAISAMVDTGVNLIITPSHANAAFGMSVTALGGDGAGGQDGGLFLTYASPGGEEELVALTK